MSLEVINLFFSIIFAVLIVGAGLFILLKSCNIGKDHHVEQLFLNARFKTWWCFIFFLFIAALCGNIALLLFFGIVSFQCLREYMSMIKTRISDHHTLIWSFYFFLPLNFVFLGLDSGILFSTFIPIVAFLFLPMVAVLRQDKAQFLSRIAKIQWGLMICVYCLSYVPALFLINFGSEFSAQKIALALFFLLFMQVGNSVEYAWHAWMSEFKILPSFLPASKTIEGFLAGFLSACVLGFLLRDFVALELWELFLLMFVALFAGFLGCMVLSSIKDSEGLECWSYRSKELKSIGMLDMMGPFCFAAPMFFYGCYFLKTM